MMHPCISQAWKPGNETSCPSGYQRDARDKRLQYSRTQKQGRWEANALLLQLLGSCRMREVQCSVNDACMQADKRWIGCRKPLTLRLPSSSFNYESRCSDASVEGSRSEGDRQRVRSS